MIIKFKPGHTEQQIQDVCEQAQSNNLTPRIERGAVLTVICILGTFNGRYDAIMSSFKQMDGVDSVLQISEKYKLASRMEHREDTVVKVGKNNAVEIGGDTVSLIAGPCSIESRDQIFSIAHDVKSAGAHVLRGGAFKPRTSPYDFQGLGEDGLKMLRDAGDDNDMPVVTEVMDPRQVELVQRYADMFQIGARNMQNFDLLKEVGAAELPVLLKRGMSARIQDFLMAAEYILAQGNSNVVLCERGVTTFDPSATRNMMDVAAIPVLRGKTHLPVAADPSHATGKPDLIPPMAYASIAAGAHAVHIEVHNDPKHALSDGDQALKPEAYARAVETMRKFAEAAGKKMV